jgi:hypothetical protein
MSRLRTLKPGFFTNEDLAACSIWARVAFEGLWMEADREGRLKDQPRLLRSRIFPYDADVDMDALLTELARPGLIRRYRVGGQAFIAIPSWHKHQRPHWKEPPSVIPPPPDDGGPPSAPDGAPETAPTSATGTIPGTSTPQQIDPLIAPADRSAHSISGSICLGSGIWDPGSGVHTHRARDPEKAGCGNPAHAWCGERFCVPRFLDAEWTRARPGDDLVGWYAALDAELTASQEPLEPDALAWLRARYRARQLAAVQPRTATRRMRHDPADRGGWTCDHEPPCRSTTVCLKRTIDDGRAAVAGARGP